MTTVYKAVQVDPRIFVCVSFQLSSAPVDLSVTLTLSLYTDATVPNRVRNFYLSLSLTPVNVHYGMQ